jgi:hypothetical protein
MIPPDFRTTLRYQSKDDPASLVADLDELHARSEAACSRRNWLVALLVFWIIACILLGLVGQTPGFIVPAVFLGIVGIIVFAVLIYRASQEILDERRRKLARVVVRHLGCDLRPGGKLELSVDFNDYCDSRYLTQTQASGEASFYQQPWLTVSGTLADGASLELSTDLVARRKERIKRQGTRKIKEDLCEHISLTLRTASLPQAAAQRWPDLVRAQPMPPGAQLHRALVKQDRLFVEVRTQRQLRITHKGSVIHGGDVETKLANHHTLLVPVLAAYQALHACRKS